MKKYLILAVALLVVVIIALPIAQRLASIRTLESKVHAATDGKSLKEVPESLKDRVQGTDWFLSGYSCPYSKRYFSLNPTSGILWDYDLSIDKESLNALFFVNLEGQITYVQLNRSDLDFCGVGSVKPISPIID